MRILLVNSIPFYVKQKAALPLGLLSIATYLSEKGHEVKIYDRSVEGSSTKKQIKAFKPQLVGVSSLGVMSFADAVSVSKTAKEFNLPVIWGGHVPGLIPETVLKTGLVDYVALREGEYAMEGLINYLGGNLSLSEVKGIAYLKNGKLVENSFEGEIDLKDLPVLDYSFVNVKKYFWRSMDYERMLHVYSSKGCIGKCTYCYSPGYCKGVWRPRPIAYFIEELKHLKEKYNIDGFYFADDLFAPNAKRVDEVCDALLESGLNLAWSTDMRTDICTETMLKKMYEAGCRALFFGVESGSPERQKSIKKKLDTEKTKETMENCKKIGIWATASYVIGFPDEEETELRQTLDLLKEVNADVSIVSLYGPMPESEMFKNLVESGKMEYPKTYKEWESLAIIDKVGNNYSRIPVLELKVISNFYLLSILVGKKGPKSDKKVSKAWTKRLISLAGDIIGRGNLRGLYLLFISAKEFIQMLFYALCFPKIRKKYDLKYR
ncbi:MAG TPA: radical SAM protein [Clostridiales bacterium]|nr:radical SAM protein [Clostridiales bacterium]